MNMHLPTHKYQRIVALGAIALGILLAWPFLGIVALAALMSFLFYGVFEKLHEKFRAPAAATLTIVTSILVIVIPLALVTTFTAVQVYHLAANVSAAIADDSAASGIKDIVNSANEILAPIVGTVSAISADDMTNFLRSTLPNIIRGTVDFVAQLLGSIPLMIILTIMYLIFMYEFLVHGKTLIKNGTTISPFQPKITRLYLKRAGLMANAMAKGQLLISLIISVLTALVLSVFLGLGDYFFLMTVVFTLLNIAPLGCGIVVIPMTIIAMLSGMVWQGGAALALYMAISNLDAVIRPRIIPRSITLSPGLTMLAVFGGISVFGVMGVVYGPILMILLVTAVQIYLDSHKTTPSSRATAHK